MNSIACCHALTSTTSFISDDRDPYHRFSYMYSDNYWRINIEDTSCSSQQVCLAATECVMSAADGIDDVAVFVDMVLI